ncbi:PRE-binding protein, putative [Plasmodium chabaudi chabaudi]|uniref:PRE-binding protein, putative n=1 Tax=Plasmodium chabaudi chabaudi TaxID=31271 RepID=A0A1D3S0D1_PLACU|nr:PRE-binding protein, putative [Plasmodium chabaudi chabaudi]
MHFITKMGRKAKPTAAGPNKKEETENGASPKNAKETTPNDKKQGGPKQNEPKNKKENVKAAETTLNGQLNGNVQKKKNTTPDSKKGNNDAEKEGAANAKDNNANKGQKNNEDQKKTQKNKNAKNEGGENNKQKGTAAEEKNNNKKAEGNAKNANNKNQDNKKKGKTENSASPQNANNKNNNKEKNEEETKKEEAKKDPKKDLKLKEDERKKIENELNKKFLKLSKQDNYKNISDKIEAEVKRKAEFEAFIVTINSSISKMNAQTPRPVNMKLTSADVENKCKEAKLKKKKLNPKSEEEMEEVNTYINYLEEQLIITKNYESFKGFQNRLFTLKKTCEEKLKENQKSLNEIKVHEKKLKFVEKIIKMKKEKQNIQIKESDIINKESSLPNDKYNTLIKPYNFLNRIQAKYFVYVDKISTNNFENKTSFNISGCNDDIENFISYLKNIDFTEKNYVNLSNKVFKIMLNICDGSFKKMEEDTNVFVHVDNETLYYCGMKDDIPKLKELIEKANNEKNTNAKNISKTIKLDSVLGRGFNKGLLKDIETKTNTLIRMNYDAKTFDASATIKGSKDADIQEAENKLNEILKGLDSEFIKFEERELFALYKKCAYELNDIRKNLNLFVIRHDNGISLVGDKENIKKALEILDHAKNIISSKSVKKKLTEEEAFLFNANYRNQIKAQTGAEVKIFNKTNYKELNISGNKTNIDDAIQMIDDLLKKRKCVEVAINERVIALLLSAKAQKIKDIEKDTYTSIQINKTSYIAQIYGHEDNIYLAKDVLENLVQTEGKDDKDAKEGQDGKSSSSNLYITVEMNIDTEHIGSIIGKKGRTINRIQEDTYVKKIHIDKENKKVFIQGTPKTVEVAQKEIQKILSRSKEENSYYDRYNSGSNTRHMASNSNYNSNTFSPSNRRQHKSSRTGKSNYRSDSSKNEVYINTNDEKAFPSLHDVTNIQSRKTKKAINLANTKKHDAVQKEIVAN